MRSLLTCTFYQILIIRVLKSERIRWTGHVACLGEVRNVCKILVDRIEGKGSLTRSRHRLEDNIRMDLGEKG